MAVEQALLALVLACAPGVHPDTAFAVIRTESRGRPWAINVNGARITRQPSTKAQALALAKTWVQLGYSVDVGYAQINSTTARRLGLTLDQVIEPCANLRVMQHVLSENYAAAVRVHGHGQRALQAALSKYNTGSQYRGFANGYVAKVYQAARPVGVQRSTQRAP